MASNKSLVLIDLSQYLTYISTTETSMSLVIRFERGESMTIGGIKFAVEFDPPRLLRQGHLPRDCHLMFGQAENCQANQLNYNINHACVTLPQYCQSTSP
jgi:hypothetical protein